SHLLLYRHDQMKPDEVRISDSHLTAFLLARGHPIRRVEGAPGRREFVFAAVPHEALVAFYGGDDRISAPALLDALRNVKGLLQQRLGLCDDTGRISFARHPTHEGHKQERPGG